MHPYAACMYPYVTLKFLVSIHVKSKSEVNVFQKQISTKYGCVILFRAPGAMFTHEHTGNH